MSNLTGFNTDARTSCASEGAAIAIISLGSNLPSHVGSPEETITEAIRRLKKLAEEQGQADIHCSSLYRTEPIDCAEGTPEFVNAAVALIVDADGSPRDLLSRLLAIEVEFGRELDSKRGSGENLARSLDLDLICFGNQKLSDDDLILPHPRALRRRFVLEPVAEMFPKLLLPGQKHAVSYLLQNLPASEAVTKL